MKTFIIKKKHSKKYLVESKTHTHTGHHCSYVWARDINQATLFSEWDFRRVAVNTELKEYLANSIKLDARMEVKIILEEK